MADWWVARFGKSRFDTSTATLIVIGVQFDTPVSILI
jgi:hypothetical protein